MLTLIATSILTLTVPKGFEEVKPAISFKADQIAYVLKGRTGFAPSINHTHLKTHSTLDQYLAKVRAMYQKDRATQFSELGKIDTPFGKGQLCQLEGKCEWGEYTSLQAIVVSGDDLHILTGCAPSSEYKEMLPIYLETFSSQ